VSGDAVPNLTFRFDPGLQLPLYESRDPRFNTLGAWLITDISNLMLVCLDALAMVDDVSRGDEPFEPWDSEGYSVAFAPSGVTIANVFVESDRATYPVAEVREALEDYWRFISALPENPNYVREFRPDLPEWEADLLNWEGKWDRTHPYRGRLF
jgi:hypothetical protein